MENDQRIGFILSLGDDNKMPRFKRKKITVDEAGKKHGFRSGLEERFIQELTEYIKRGGKE